MKMKMNKIRIFVFAAIAILIMSGISLIPEAKGEASEARKWKSSQLLYEESYYNKPLAIQIPDEILNQYIDNYNTTYAYIHGLFENCSGPDDFYNVINSSITDVRRRFSESGLHDFIAYLIGMFRSTRIKDDAIAKMYNFTQWFFGEPLLSCVFWYYLHTHSIIDININKAIEWDITDNLTLLAKALKWAKNFMKQKHLSKNFVALYCHQQALLFCAGVKTIFSEKSDSQYILKNNTGRFEIFFTEREKYVRFRIFKWWSKWIKDPSQHHVEIVIKYWNGTKMFREIDPWENENKNWEESKYWIWHYETFSHRQIKYRMHPQSSFWVEGSIGKVSIWDVHPGEKIQAVINKASNGDTIFIYNGTYNENITVNKTLNLLGNGSSCIINGRINITAPNVLLYGLNISNPYGSAVHINRNGTRLENIVITNSRTGINLSASNSIIYNNLIYDCTYGVYIQSGNDNLIYHNNFINNDQNAIDYGTENHWNLSYYLGGNYWSDFDEPSEGAYDNNSDGIVDTPYDVIPNGKDYYPLMEENGWETLSPDYLPPITTKEIGLPNYDNGTWITSNTKIWLNATDGINGTGVNVTYYEIWWDSNNDGIINETVDTMVKNATVFDNDVNDSNPNWGEISINFTLNEEGLHEIKWFSVDNVGNVENSTTQIHYVDNSPPETTIEFGEPIHGNHITSSTLIYLNSTDEGCGVKEIHYSYDGGNTWHVVNGSNAVFTIPDECEHEILYYAVDYLGNAESVKSVIVNVDSSSPETTIEFGTPYYSNGIEE